MSFFFFAITIFRLLILDDGVFVLNLSLGLSESALFDFRLVDLVFDDEADASDVEDLFLFLESL